MLSDSIHTLSEVSVIEKFAYRYCGLRQTRRYNPWTILETLAQKANVDLQSIFDEARKRNAVKRRYVIETLKRLEEYSLPFRGGAYTQPAKTMALARAYMASWRSAWS